MGFDLIENDPQSEAQPKAERSHTIELLPPSVATPAERKWRDELWNAMDQVRVNALKGLPRLLHALQQTAMSTNVAYCGVADVPAIFDLLGDVMYDMTVESITAVICACCVIEHCVILHNNRDKHWVRMPPPDIDIIGEQWHHRPKIQTEDAKEIQRILGEWMCKTQAHTWFWEKHKDDRIKVIKAIANATIALFELDGEYAATRCKLTMGQSDGIIAAMRAMEISNDISLDVKEDLAYMLSAVVRRSEESVDKIIEGGWANLMLPYVEEPERHNVPEEMRVHCRAVLEACTPEPSRENSREDTGVFCEAALEVTI